MVAVILWQGDWRAGSSCSFHYSPPQWQTASAAQGPPGEVAGGSGNCSTTSELGTELGGVRRRGGVGQSHLFAARADRANAADRGRVGERKPSPLDRAWPNQRPLAGGSPGHFSGAQRCDSGHGHRTRRRRTLQPRLMVDTSSGRSPSRRSRGKRARVNGHETTTSLRDMTRVGGREGLTAGVTLPRAGGAGPATFCVQRRRLNPHRAGLGRAGAGPSRARRGVLAERVPALRAREFPTRASGVGGFLHPQHLAGARKSRACRCSRWGQGSAGSGSWTARSR